MAVVQYLNNINTRYKPGNTAEYAFRNNLELSESLMLDFRVTDEPIEVRRSRLYSRKRNIPVIFIGARYL